MRKQLLLLLLISFLVLPLVSAEIFLEQPASVYNIGDEITLSATVDSLSDSFFNLDFVCDNGKVTITHDVLSSTIVKKTFLLTNAFISNLKGQCFFVASYADSTAQTQAFIISDSVDASSSLDKLEFNPSEGVNIFVDAVKANKKPLNGFAEIVFEQAGISLQLPVVNGRLVYNFSLPNNIASGTYSIKINVYEKDKQGNIINKANLENNVIVKQQPQFIEVVIADQEATPGSDYKFKIVVYDQTNQTISSQARFSLLNGNDEKISDRIVNSDEDILIPIPLNESSGYRTIVGKMDSFSTKRYFYIPEVKKASFEIINTTLKITNIGNVVYNKNVEIGIGKDKEIIELNLGISQSISYNLQAPKGSYDVAVTDGIESFSASGVALTGNAIRVVDLADSSSIISRYSLVWLFIIGVLGLFIFGVSKGLGKEKFMAYMPNFSRLFRREKFGNMDNVSPSISTIKSSDVRIGYITPTEAEHSLVIKGVKEPCSLIAVKIKNKSRVEKSDYFKPLINEICSEITSGKGTVYNNDDFIIGIFAPSATKTFKNEFKTITIAQSINSSLTLHNTKFKDKIDFGIGVCYGDLVVEIDKVSKKLKFTSIGPTLSLAKKISECALNSLLLSQTFFRRVANTVKAKKVVRGDLDVYEITSVVNREDNSRFISDFKARNEYG